MLTPRPRVTIEVQARVRRASPVYLDLLASAPEKLANLVSELEADPLFSPLEERGVVRKVGLRGSIPHWKQRNREEERAISLLVKHGLGDKPGWREEFAAAKNRDHREGLARKYHLRTEEVRVISDYARGEQKGSSVLLDERKAGGPAHRSSVEGGRMEKIAALVERYGLSQEQFTRDFLLGEADAESLAEEYGMPSREAREVLELIEEFVTFASGQGRLTEDPAGSGELEAVASVTAGRRGEAPKLVMEQFPGWAMYRIDEAMARSLELEGVSRSHLARFLARLRAASQVTNCLVRIVAHIFWAQREYFSTLDASRLQPLSQAEIARDLGVPRSTVCRALKGRGLRTPLGVQPLGFFCQRKGDVVRRLGKAHPEMTDGELALLLTEEYGCRLGRRSVAHHRGRSGGTEGSS